LSSEAAGGELFTLTDSSRVVCGNTAFPLNKTDFDPANAVITKSVDLFQFYGTCTVNLALREGADIRTPAVFGGTTSPVFSTTVTLGPASTLDATEKQFAGNFVEQSDGTAAVRVQFSGDQDGVAKLTTDWHEQVLGPDGTACGSDNAPPDDTVPVSPSCVANQGDQTGWTFTVSYTDKRDGNRHTLGPINIPGTPPGFVPPCVVSSQNFTATWSGSASTPSVTVAFVRDKADLRGCSNFKYTLQSPGSRQTCDSANVDDVQTSQTLSAASCEAFLGNPGWNVEVTYKSARGDEQPVEVAVTGQPPTPTPTPSSTP
jgi:hypothetical protein